MNEQQHNRLSDEVFVYHDAAAVKQGWLHVAVAFVLTAGIFVLLPFTEMVAKRPEKKVDIRRVDTLAAELKPPEIERIEKPPEMQPEEDLRPVEPTPRPQLDVPQSRERQTLDLVVSLDIGMDFSADFAMDLALSPQVPPPVAETAAPPLPPTPPPPSVFETGDLDRLPTPILRIRPVYPYRARMRNIEGFVDLRFTVNTEGSVSEIHVVNSEPEDMFEAAATRAVARWRFEPGIKDGKEVPVRMQVTLRFTLE